MASVTFTGSGIGNSLFVSGIVSRFIDSGTIRNCVNYGFITHSGDTTGQVSTIGSIVALCGSSGYKYIQNCANYGTITFKGTAKTLYIGGIVGSSWAGTNTVENCVSAGRVVNSGQVTENSYNGAVIGYISSKQNPITTITHCLWTNDLGYNDVYDAKSEKTATVTNTSFNELSVPTVNELNEYAGKNTGWSNWFMLHLNGGRINNLNQEALIVTQKHFPDPVKDGSPFSFWCLDNKCTGRYDPITTNITGVTDLYAVYSSDSGYVVTFGFGNGTKTTKTVTYGESYGTLPSPGERTGYTFNGWFTEEDGQGERITEEITVEIPMDHTLYAHWTINNYTITFVFNNGAENEVRVLNFNETLLYPEDPTKEGYTFNGWSPKPARVPAMNVTITAQWTINNYTITFVFNNGADNDVRVLNFNETIVYPENVVKEGYTFNGWSLIVVRMPAEDVTVTAQWTEKSSEPGSSSITMSSSVSISSSQSVISSEDKKSSEGISPESKKFSETSSIPSSSEPEKPTEFVEIVFGKKDLKEEEIREIIKRYTDEEFTIVKFEINEDTGETRVIIKFVDSVKASEFVREVKESKRPGDNFIRRVNFVSGKFSFSSILTPTLFNLFLI